jgi:hypothetical protein
MNIGPILQNPGRVLLHIFMVGLLSQVMNSTIVNVVNVSVVKEKKNASVVNAVTVVNENVCVKNAVNESVCVENVLYENVSVGNMDVNVVNGDSVEDEDYAVNKSNVDVDHMVNKDNVHVIDKDANNADINNVRKDVQEKPETRDVVNNINPEGKHNDEKTVEEQVHKKPEERDGTSRSSFTYYTRQSSTKTESVVGMLNFQF